MGCFDGGAAGSSDWSKIWCGLIWSSDLEQRLERQKRDFGVKNGMESGDSDEMKRIGNEMYKRGSFVDALRLYDRAITLSPGNASYRSNRAAALSGLGRLGEAVRECEEAVKLDEGAAALRGMCSLVVKLSLKVNGGSDFEVKNGMESGDSEEVKRIGNEVKRIGNENSEEFFVRSESDQGPPANPNKEAEKKKGSTIKDKEKNKRMKGQSSHASWKSETEMQLWQQFD
ncbi:unnamed protein product [Rhodiola kirilowii]